MPNFLGNLLTYACDRRSKMVKTASWFEFLDHVVNKEMMMEVADRAGNSTEDLTSAVFERAQALYMISLFLTGSTRTLMMTSNLSGSFYDHSFISTDRERRES